MYTKNITIFIIVMITVLLSVPITCTDSAVVYNNPDYIKFDSVHGGSIKFNIMNNDNNDLEYKVVVYNVLDGEIILKENMTPIPSNTMKEISVNITGFNTIGTHMLRVMLIPEDRFDGTGSFTVNIIVEKNILYNWRTYVTMSIVAIASIIFVYMRIYDTPKKKSVITFEELDAQHKAMKSKK